MKDATTKKSFKLVHVSMAPKARKPRVWKAWAIVGRNGKLLRLCETRKETDFAVAFGVGKRVRVTITADAMLSERGK